MDRPREFDDLLLANMPYIRAFARKLTERRGEADDLIQITCLKILNNWEHFQPGTNFQAWAITVCKYAFFNQVRLLKKRTLFNIDIDDQILNVQAPLASAEDICYLHEAFKLTDKLEPNKRQTLTMALLGSNYHDISVAQNIKFGTVKSRMSRAHETMRELVE